MNGQQLSFEFGDGAQATPEDDPHPATPVEHVLRNVRYKLRRIRPPVKAHGEKFYLARQIVPVLLSSATRPTEYLEPCAFGASVFLAMPKFERELLGDINPDVVALWRTLAHDKLAALLSERIANVAYTENAFHQSTSHVPESQLDTAVRFMIRSRFSRGGFGKVFAWSTRTRGGRPGDENSWDTFRNQSLPQIIDRAQGVEVLHDACWWTVWQSRHHVNRLIYDDPPYMQETRTAKRAYGPFEMTQLQHFWLVSALKSHSGPAAISGYRCTDYDRWLRNWRRLDFDMPNNSGQRKRKNRRCESLWINW